MTQQTLGDPTKTITLTNADTGKHEHMSFSDAAHRLGTNVRHIVELFVLAGDDGVAEFTARETVAVKYLLKRIK